MQEVLSQMVSIDERRAVAYSRAVLRLQISQRLVSESGQPMGIDERHRRYQDFSGPFKASSKATVKWEG